MSRYERWNLYEKAKALGLEGRSGGYTLSFLQDYLQRAKFRREEPVEVSIKKARPFNPYKVNFLDKDIDPALLETTLFNLKERMDKTYAIRMRQQVKTHNGKTDVFHAIKEFIKDWDKEEGLTKAHSFRKGQAKTGHHGDWQDRKQFTTETQRRDHTKKQRSAKRDKTGKKKPPKPLHPFKRFTN